MKKENGNKGITLIALIITIIVMLILVGVTVAVAINGGLIETAKKAARKTERAKMDEEIQTIIAAMNADILAHPENHKITEDEFPVDDETITEELAFAFYFKKPVKNIEENFKIKENIIKTYSYGTEEFRSADIFELIKEQCLDENTFFEDGIVKFPCTYKENIELNIIVEMKFGDASIEVVSYSLELSEGMTIKQTADEVELTAGGNIKEIREGAPIPKGFYYVAGTKDTGVVISDDPADENNESGNNGNQFVWVPVKVNPKLEIKMDSDKDIKTVRILNSDGYDENIEVNSDVFEKTIDIQKNSIYEIIVAYEDGSQTDNLINVDKKYEITDYGIYELIFLANTDGNLDEIKQENYDSMKDEVILPNNPQAVLENKIDYFIEIERILDANSDLEIEDKSIEKEQVLKYGGFYIGRYEIGTNNTVKNGNRPKTNISFEEAERQAKEMYNDNNLYGINSTIPSGASYDRIFSWIIETGNKNPGSVYGNSNSWGNYRPSITTNASLKNTGSSYSYKANNIYDLAGNVSELTAEIYHEENIDGHISRGGDYRTLIGVAYNRTTDDASSDYIGYRPMLYFAD